MGAAPVPASTRKSSRLTSSLILVGSVFLMLMMSSQGVAANPLDPQDIQDRAEELFGQPVHVNFTVPPPPVQPEIPPIFGPLGSINQCQTTPLGSVCIITGPCAGYLLVGAQTQVYTLPPFVEVGVNGVGGYGGFC